ncbi:MAG: filamentous hemagglutinin N-terminal domain-containing protein [Victivallales bacterium]|nr:filamentous hemagglutinin N-terminal domain-containing protein [Victivallales bacterium]
MTMLTQSQKRKSTMKLFSVLMVAILMFSPGGLLAGSLPSGHKVVNGKVTVTVNGKTMDIDQATQKAIVNWQQFSIDEGYTVNVNQINSAAAMLARVIGNDPSNIFGNLNATGHFYLVNQNGVYFGPNSRVDVGAIIASTMDILDDDFMAGKLNFFGEAKGNVVNEGQINADAVALIGQNVENRGTINANQVGLVAAQKAVTLSDFGGGAKLSVDFSDFNKAEDVAAPTTVVNEGTINAGDDGDVTLFAEAGEASNENGAIIADTAEISGAKVDLTKLGSVKANELLIDPAGVLNIESGPANGGFVDVEWTYGDATINEILGNMYVSSLTLSYDKIALKDDLNFESTKSLTLRTNTANGIFTSNGYSITTKGDLTLDAGLFIDALSISAGDGQSVNVYVRDTDSALTIADIAAGSVLIHAPEVTFDSTGIDIQNTTLHNAGSVIITAKSADIRLTRDSYDESNGEVMVFADVADFLSIAQTGASDNLYIFDNGSSLVTLRNISTEGDLSVAASNVTLSAAILSANNIDISADTINVQDNNLVTAGGKIAFNGPVQGASDGSATATAGVATDPGNLTVKADNIDFNGAVALNRLTADAKTVYINDNHVTIEETLDFSGVDTTYVADWSDNSKIKAETMKLNDVRAEGDDIRIILEGTDILLNGDLRAQGIYIDGNITLMGDVSIIAGNDNDNFGGFVDFGKSDQTGYIVGSHDLVIKGTDVELRGGVEVENLYVTASASGNGTGTFYYGNSGAYTFNIANDVVIIADDMMNIEPDKAHSITVGKDINLLSRNGVEITQNITAGNDVNINASDDFVLQSEITAGRNLTLAAKSIKTNNSRRTRGDGPKLIAETGDIDLFAKSGDIVLKASDGAEVFAGSNRYFMTADGNIEIDKAIKTVIIDSKFQAEDIKLNSLRNIISTVFNSTDGNVEIKAAGSSWLTDVTIDSYYKATVSSYGALNELTVYAGDDTTITAGVDINGLIIYNDDGNVTVTADRNIAGADINSDNYSGEVKVNVTAAYGDISDLAILAGGDATVTATEGGINGANITAKEGTATVTAKGDIIDLAILAGDASTVTADSQIDGLTLNALGDAMVSGRLGVLNSNIWSSGAATVTSDDGLISNTSIKSIGNTTVSAYNKITGLTIDSSGAEATVTGRDDISGLVINAAGNATVTTRFGDITGITINAHGNATVTAENDIIGSTIVAFGTATVTAEDELDGLTVVGGKGVTAEGSWIVGGEYIAEGGNISLTATEGTVANATIVAKAADSTLTIDTQGELDGLNISTKGDLDLTAIGFAGGTYISEEGNVTLTATNLIDATTMLAKSGNVTATAAAIKGGTTLTATAEATIDAAEVEQTIASAEKVIIKNATTAAVTTVAPEVEITDSVTVAINDQYDKDVTTVTATADTLKLSSVSDIDAFTTVSNLAVNNVNGYANITNDGNVTILSSALIAGMLDITANGGDITISRSTTVQAGDISLWGDNVNVNFSTVAATTGDLVISGNNSINLTDAIVTASAGQTLLSGDVTAAGAIQLSADKAVWLDGSFTGGDDVRIIADQLEIVADVAADGVLDLSGVRETVINDNVKLSGEQVRLGAVKGEDTTGAAVDLTVEGEEIVLNGNILAKNIAINGGVSINDDVDIVASDGTLTIGGDYVWGSHDLSLLSNKDVTVNGKVQLQNLLVYATENFNYFGDSLAIIEDLTVTANGNIELTGTALEAARDFSLLSTGGTATLAFAQGAVVGRDLAVAAFGNIEFTGAELIADHDLSLLSSGGTISLAQGSTASAGHDMSILSDGELKLESTFFANNDMTLSGASVKNGPATLIALTGDIAITALNGDIDFTDPDSIVAAGTNRYFFTAAEGDINVTAIKTAIVDSKFEASKSIDLTLAEGSIVNSTFVADSATIAAEKGELDGVTVSVAGQNVAAGETAIDASGIWVVGGTYVAEKGDILVEATEGSVVGAVVLAKDGDSTVTVNANKEIDGLTVTNVGDIKLEAFGITASAYISETGDIELKATGEDISGVYAKSKQGHVELTTENGFDIIDSTADAYTYAKINASGDVINSVAVGATETADITAAKSIIDSTAIAVGDVSATAKDMSNVRLTSVGGNASLKADNAITESIATAKKVTIEAPNASVTTIAPEVEVVAGSGDVAINDQYKDATILNATADKLTLSSISDIDAITTVGELVVNNVSGQADITNDGDLTILNSTLTGNLSVTADNITIDWATVSAGSVVLIADEITLKNAVVAATSGNAELTGDIKAEGQLIISADQAVYLNGNLEGGSDVRVIADELELFGETYTVADGILDLTGARETVVNVNGTTITAKQMRLGATRQEEGMANDLNLEGGDVHLAGDILVQNLNVKADKLTNNDVIVTAATATFEGNGTLDIGKDFALNTNAYTVTVKNGGDVTLNDVNGADTELDIEAAGTVTLTSVSTMTGSVTADTLDIEGAKNASFTTTIANLTVNNVSGQADVTNDGALNILQSALNGELSVAADNITIDWATVSAGSVVLQGDEITLKDAVVAATSGNAELTGDIKAEGQLIISASQAVFLNGDLTGGSDVRVIADQLELFGENVAIDGILDLTGSRETILDVNGMTTISAGEQLRLGSVRTEEGTQAELTLDGKIITIDGDVSVYGLTFGDSATVVLDDDITIFSFADLTLTQGNIYSTSGRYTMTAADNLEVTAIKGVIADSLFTAGKNLTFTSESGMNIVNTTFVTTGEGVATITAGAPVEAGTRADVRKYAVSDADLNGVVGDFAGSVILTAREIDGSAFTAAGTGLESEKEPAAIKATADYILNSDLIAINGDIEVYVNKTINDTVVLAKNGKVKLETDGEIDGMTFTAVKNLDITADYIVGSVLVSEEGDVNATAKTLIDATDMLAKNGNVTAKSAAIKGSTTLTAIKEDGTATVTIDAAEEGGKVDVEQTIASADKVVIKNANDAAVTTVAPQIEITDSVKVAIDDQYNKDVTTVTATAETLILSSVGDIAADTQVTNLAVSNVSGSADVTNEGDINILNSTLTGDLSVTADKITVDSTAVSAGSVVLLANEIDLKYAIVAATSGNAELSGDIKADGSIELSADKAVYLNGDLSDGEEGAKDVRVVADELELNGENYTVENGILDFTGARETVFNVNGTTITAKQMRLGATKQEEGMANDLNLAGGDIHLAGDILVQNLNVKADKLTNADVIVTAATATFEGNDKLDIGKDLALNTNAYTVTVKNGGDVVTLNDVNADGTEFDIEAAGTVTLTSVSTMTGSVKADTLDIEGAKIAEFNTTISNLTVNNVSDTADITNEGELNILKSTLTGDLSVTADKVTVADTAVSAGSVVLLADEIDLTDAIVAATAGNAEFTGDIKADGQLILSADQAVYLNGNLEGGKDVRVIADELELFGDAYTVAEGILDLTGARETVVNVNGTTITAKQMRLGATKQEEGMTNDLNLVGGDIHFAGDILVQNLNVKADKLTNNDVTVTAATATFEGNDELAIGQFLPLNVNAYEVTVKNGGDVTLNDVNADLTTMTIDATGKVVLTSVSDMDGDITADTLDIEGAQNASFTTKIANLTVNNVSGQADITNEGDLNILQSALNGELSVAADNIKIDSTTVTAGAIVLQGGTIAMDNAIVAATSGSAEFTGDITSEGQLIVSADQAVIFNGTLTGGDDVRVIADQLELFGDSYTVEKGTLDIAGVRETVIHENVEISAKQLRVGAVKAEENTQADLTLKGDEIGLYGNIQAANVTIDGGVSLANDVSIIARYEDEFGTLDIGGDYVYGTYDLTLRGADVNMHGAVEVAKLDAYAVDGTFTFDGETLKTLGDMSIYATEDLTLDSGEITAVNGVYTMTSDGSLTVTAIKGVVKDSTFTAGKDLTFESEDGMNIVNTTFITTGEEAKDGTATITATNSDMNGVVGNFDGKAILTAREIDGSAITAGIGLESSDEDVITATADYIVNSDLIAVQGNIKAEVGTIVDSVLMAKNGSVDLDADGEIDGMALTAKEDLKVSADYIVGSTLVSEEGNVDVTAKTSITNSTALSKHHNVMVKAGRIEGGTVIDAIEGNIAVAGADDTIEIDDDGNVTFEMGGDGAVIMDATFSASANCKRIDVENAVSIDDSVFRSDKVILASADEETPITIGVDGPVTIDGAETITLDNAGYVNIVSNNKHDVQVNVNNGSRSENISIAQRGGGDLVLYDTAGNLRIGQISADGMVYIEAEEGSILDGSDFNETPNVVAEKVELTAKRDIGDEDDALDILADMISGTGITAGDLVNIATKGAFRRDTDRSDADITARTVKVTAEEGIGVLSYRNDGEALGDTIGQPETAQLLRINKASDVQLNTTGGDADIAVKLAGSSSVRLVAMAEGNDSDIFASRDGAGSLVLHKVEATDGNVIIDARASNVSAVRVRALDNGDKTGIVNDAHSVYIKAGTLNIANNGIRSDYEVVIEANGDVSAGGGPGDVNITAGEDVIITTGGKIGDVESNSPVTIDADGEFHVNKLPGTEGEGKDKVWVYADGRTGDGKIYYDGKPNTEPGIIYWNGRVWGGNNTPVNQVSRAEGEFNSQIRAMIAAYNGNYLADGKLIYFPHVYMMLDLKPQDMSIEHIMQGCGTIDGLPEGVGPDTIDIYSLDDTFSWYQGDKWEW